MVRQMLGLEERPFTDNRLSPPLNRNESIVELPQKYWQSNGWIPYPGVSRFRLDFAGFPVCDKG
jgi:hypothetical protein